MLALLVGQASCSSSNPPAHASATQIRDPAHTIAANPDYSASCAPSGLDSSLTCIAVALQAVDNARAKEGLAAMRLPAGYSRLSVPEQVFVAVNTERVDRGLAPFTALTDALNQLAGRGADTASDPPDPGQGYVSADTEWIGAVANGLDADYLWMYDDGPGSGVSGCGKAGGSGCWADRHVVLDRFGPGTLVMGAALNPTADTGNDRGGPSLAAILANTANDPGPIAYRWASAVADTQAGTIRPRTGPPPNTSASGIPDPGQTEPPVPDYTQACGATLDSSPPCLAAIVEALNNARAKEAVKPLVLPASFSTMTIPQQLLVAINLERVDRGLAPFAGLTASLNANAQRGADIANDPPDPGSAYNVSDTEWAGGSVNGLDAVYGFMYDDGKGSGNLDCPAKGGPGCWGHRHGILDNFGTVGTLVMGGAVNPTADTTNGDKGGISIAATLAITSRPTGPLVFRWTP
ncbi:MAG TPA: hypothetical protein VHT75_19275 [Acidimicrobiales bacterium]|nr:hypothetical protein [Acidimicrobiales bacterium]